MYSQPVVLNAAKNAPQKFSRRNLEEEVDCT